MMPKIIDWMSEEEYELKAKRYNEIRPADSAYPLCCVKPKEEKEMDELFPYVTECTIDQPHIDALVQELVNNKYVICGDTHQHKAIPVFNDGYLLMSMRSWAEVMASSVYYSFPNAARRKYWNYTNFYMACNCPGKERLPKENEKCDIS